MIELIKYILTFIVGIIVGGLAIKKVDDDEKKGKK